MKHTSQKPIPTAQSLIRILGGVGLATIAGWSSPVVKAAPNIAEISVNIGLDAPPPPQQEVVVERDRPGPGYVWVQGYWGGSPRHYEWQKGHWERPPHEGARWTSPRWEKDHDGHYHMIKGGWDHDERGESGRDQR